MKQWNNRSSGTSSCIEKLLSICEQQNICELRTHESLRRHSTMGIGGDAAVLALPKSAGELTALIRTCESLSCLYRVVGNGSNIIFSDQGFSGVIIKTVAMKQINFLENTTVFAAAGVQNQTLIRKGHEHNMGGLEYLCSVPGTIGGAIFMNAGRGEAHNLSIGQRVLSVRIWDGMTERDIPAADCLFAYRTSVFHRHRDWVILGALLQLDAMTPEEGARLIAERMAFVNTHQNRNYPNCGSVFLRGYNPGIMGDTLVTVGNVAQDPLGNWIINTGGGTAADAQAVVVEIERRHRDAGQEAPVREIEFINYA